ncbi:alpha/beta hydrolase fold domain containing protein [Acanthamoeba castellanii str. Neff]|uniref:Alpha/beta hydrolase fold domain containing protein n=1 Tax=Acanthamoeba castellanii (strain ATCC 30010 / Neff) TaxID=1257118 RepID=L8HI00_ACACF|nr:alpha/beta hydrolase fold domain containing protein [Acanthamoeba castellanii str. Neff]ELR24842.1 alpha/beta hydrolase fold domain containing protein [Acanthamoeba castellanii str. Neff]
MDDGTPLEVLASSSSSSSSSITTLSSSTSATATTTTPTAATAKRVSKAKLLRLGSSMGLAVPLALTRRAWKGAAYASWSVGFEVQHEMGQALLRNHHRFSLTDLCQLSADFAADPPAETSSIRIVYCGGIRADMVQYRSPFAQRRPNNDKNEKKKKNDGRHLENRAILSKSESNSRGGKVAYRSKSHEDEEVELKNLSKSSSTLATSTSSSSPSSSTQMDDLASTTRVKLSKRRIKSENDNLGRDNQFRSTSGGDASVHGPNGNVENGNGEEDEEKPAATVLYLHGGGFCVGSSTTYRRCLWHFSREMKGLRFLAVDYSLSPHVRFPTALQECLHAYLWLIDENGGNVVLAGDSAGGCLVLALLFLIRQMRDDAASATNNGDDDHEENESESESDEQDKKTVKGNTKLPIALPSRKTPPAFPLCAFLMSPWVDLSESSSVMKPESYAQPASHRSQSGLARRFIDAYLGTSDYDGVANNNKNAKKNDDRKNESEENTTTTTTPDVLSPYISPIYGDLQGLPPVMLTAGGEEPLLADIQALHAKCVDAGLEVELDVGEHMNHAYQVFHDPSSHREVERSIQAVGRFVWRHIARRQLHDD